MVQSKKIVFLGNSKVCFCWVLQLLLVFTTVTADSEDDIELDIDGNAIRSKVSFLIKGSVWRDDKSVPWNENYSDHQSAEFKELSAELCATVTAIYGQNNTLREAWADCQLVTVENTHAKSQLMISLYSENLRNADVSYRSEQFTGYLRGLLLIYNANPNTSTDYFGIVSGISDAKASTSTIEVMIAGPIFMDRDEIMWNENYSDTTSTAFKDLEHSLCNTTHKILAQNATINESFISCSISEMEDFKIDMEITINLNEAIMKQNNITYHSNTFTEYIEGLILMYAADPDYSVKYFDSVDYVSKY